MKTVLLAATCSLVLAFAAHAADAPMAPYSPAPVSHAVPPTVSASGATCIDGAAVTPTAYSTDADAEADRSSCSRYLSTQTLVQPSPLGRT